MAVYRKAPQTFTSGSRITSKRSFSLSPFGGLEINENPLTTTAGSASDSLNMVVDDNSFLTLRPRIIEDADYLNAKQIVTAYCGQNDLVWNNEVTKLKNGYLFLVNNAIRMTITNEIDAHGTDGEYVVLALNLCGNIARFNFGDEDIVVAPFEVVTHILAALERRDSSVKSITDNWTWSSDGTNYIDFYYNAGQPLPITINNYSLYDDYYQPTGCTATFSFIAITPLLLFVPSSGTTPYYEIDSEFVYAIDSFDDFIIVPEKDYYRFIKKTTGVHYKFFLDGSAYKFEEAPIYIPTYKAALVDTISIHDAPIYEDLNILSNQYKLSVLYNERSSIDLKILASNATTISGNPYIIESHEGLSGKDIVYHSVSGYIYFLATDYSIAQGLSAGSYNLTFYFYSFETKTETVAFVIKVYAGGSPNDGITRANLALLYLSSITKDYNQNTIYKLMYDSSTHSLIRHGFTESWESGSAVVTSFDIHSYSISTKAYKKVSLNVNGNTSSFDWATFYTTGNLGVLFLGSGGVWGTGLVVYSLSSNTFTFLIGQAGAATDNNTRLIPASLSQHQQYPFLYKDAYLRSPITHYFVAGGKSYLISRWTLNYLLNQSVINVATDIVLSPSGLPIPTTSMVSGIFYFDIEHSIDMDKSTDLGARINYTPVNNSSNAISISETQVLLYTVSSVLYRAKPIARIPIKTPTDADSLSLDTFYSAHPEFYLESISITPWGTPMLFGQGNADLRIVKVDMDESIRKNVLQYWYQPLDIGTVYHGLLFPTNIAFNVISHGGNTFRRIVITKDTLEYTYSLTNNDKNPLKLSGDIITQHQKYADAHRFTSKACGTALINSSQIYYNEHYLFITEPLNYDYIPVIHCHESIRPIRFATSYAQTLGVVYEQNNIEYVSFSDNPFVDKEFVAHPQVCIFESVEQRAIDYLPNGYLVTFTGITVYINEGGVYALNFNANTPQDAERKASLISSAVNAKLLKEDISTCILANSDPYVLFMFPKSGYTSVYALKVLTGLWFYWELPITITKVVDDNRQLRLQGANRYVLFTEDAEVVEVDDSIQVHEGSVERYLDLDKTPIKWYWKSQLLPFGSPTSQKQITDTFFTFVNPNAGITFDTDTFEITQNRITSQPFGLRFYTYRELISESPVVAYDGQLNIINNLRRRTYLNRFKYCQMLCYNIEDEQTPSDKVRIAHISILYKYLTGGK